MTAQSRSIAHEELTEVAPEAQRRWRQAHPRAPLDAIMAAVDAALAPVRAWYIQELA